MTHCCLSQNIDTMGIWEQHRTELLPPTTPSERQGNTCCWAGKGQVCIWQNESRPYWGIWKIFLGTGAVSKSEISALCLVQTPSTSQSQLQGSLQEVPDPGAETKDETSVEMAWRETQRKAVYDGVICILVCQSCVLLWWGSQSQMLWFHGGPMWQPQPPPRLALRVRGMAWLPERCSWYSAKFSPRQNTLFLWYTTWVVK